MKEIIKIRKDEAGKETVNARELWMFLESKQQFGDWIKGRIKQYDFVENQDFTLLHNSMKPAMTGFLAGGHNKTEYHITIDMAKELSMVERNQRGKQARQYFIECERKLKDPLAMLQDPDQLRTLLLSYTEKVKVLETKNQEMKPKALFADAVATSRTSILVGELAKLLKQNGHPTGQNRLFDWLRNNGFLIKRRGSDFNMPTQRSMEQGLFEIKERTLVNPDESVRIVKTSKVTGKGQQYFINLFLADESNEDLFFKTENL